MNPKDYVLGRKCACCRGRVCDQAQGLWCRKCRQSVATNTSEIRLPMETSDFVEIDGVLVRTVRRA